MNPAFTVKVGQQIFPGLVVTGKFDGRIPSLACGTTGGKILIHSPHEVDLGNSAGQLNSVRFLNLNRKITSLAAGSLGPTSLSQTTPNSDLIFVGTQSNLLAYDVDRNADSFFVDVQDGVNSLVTGKLGSSSKSLVIAGGNCSILGFDVKGAECLWNVTGDNVSAMALCDLDVNNQPALLVGSDDFEIRIFRNEDLVGEVTEADRVTFLHSLRSGPKFAYGLANGTVGVYSGAKTRLWRVKTKNQPTALYSYDLDSDGVPEVFSGWSTGQFTVRREENGEVLFKEAMDAPVAGIVSADYRMDGKEEVMICSESGEVRAYLSTDVEFGAMLDSGVGKDNAADQKALGELQTQKLELIAELKLLEKTLRSSSSKSDPSGQQVGTLPNNTTLVYSLESDSKLKAVVLRVEVNTDVQIVNLIAVDLEGIVLVDREVVAISPKAQSKIAVLPLKPAKHCPCTLRIQTHVATRSLGAQLHVFESDVVVPRFSVFKQLGPDTMAEYAAPSGKVIFSVRESIDRLVTWMETAFLLKAPIKTATAEKLQVYFTAVCRVEDQQGLRSTGGRSQEQERSLAESSLSISVAKVTESGQTHCKVRIQCDSMELASDLVQDIARHFALTELDSEADFPAELLQFEEVLQVVADCNDARIRLAADMADDSQRVKALVIRAEDSRLMCDMEATRRAYTELNALNQQLVGGYGVRAANHESLLVALKEVNQMIQRAANLRMGKSKSRVVTDCRAAVKLNNMNSLFRIIRQGFDSAGGAASQAKK